MVGSPDYAALVRTRRGHLLHCQSVDGVNKVGGDIAQRNEGKAPVLEVAVRHTHLVILKYQSVIDQNIQVNFPGAPLFM